MAGYAKFENRRVVGDNTNNGGGTGPKRTKDSQNRLVILIKDIYALNLSHNQNSSNDIDNSFVSKFLF